VRTADGGAWEDLIVGVRGFNHGGVEWMVRGGDMGIVCGGRISGGSRFCAENADVCTVNMYLASRAELKPEWMYIETTETWSKAQDCKFGMGGADIYIWWRLNTLF
jgi:hypothetical protein